MYLYNKRHFCFHPNCTYKKKTSRKRTIRIPENIELIIFLVSSNNNYSDHNLLFLPLVVLYPNVCNLYALTRFQNQIHTL